MGDTARYYLGKDSWFITNAWRTYNEVLEFFINYGWPVLGTSIFLVLAYNWVQPRVKAWLRDREDALHHKDPDAILERAAAQRARVEALQRQQQAASRRARELQAEKEEEKRREAAELLEKYGVAGGRRLGREDDGYLPLSGGGAPASTYRAPKRSACSGGGCGR